MNKRNKGWIVTVGAMGVNLALGCFYSWSIIAAALVKELGYTKTQASLPFTALILLSALMMVPGGRIFDRYGPRVCGVIGGICTGIGFLLSGYATSLPMLVVSFGLIFGIGLGVGYAGTIPAAVSWFPPQKRGMIGGLVVAALGFSSVYVAPLTQYLLGNVGIQKTFIIEGIAFMIAILIFAQFLSRPTAGYKAEEASDFSPSVPPNPQRQYTPSEMLSTYQFYLIWCMYAFGVVAGLMVTSQAAMIGKMQANIEWGFALVSLLAVCNCLGRFLGGWLSDNLGREKTLMLVFMVQMINMLLFRFYTNFSLLVCGITACGICWGSLLGIFPAMTYDYYGLKHSGMNYGLVFTAYGIAGVIGPITGGRIVDYTNSYNGAYLVAAAFLAIALVMLRFLKKPVDNPLNHEADALSA